LWEFQQIVVRKLFDLVDDEETDGSVGGFEFEA